MPPKFLTIGAMATTAHAKYREMHRGACETWVPQCEKVYLFCGYHHDQNYEAEMRQLTDCVEFVHLEDVKEDGGSASYKHWLGLAYLMEHDPAQWYAIYGSDNYVRVDRVKEELAKFNGQLPLIAGGSIQCRTLDVQVPFSLGGGGSYVTHRALEMILDQWPGDRMTQARSLCRSWEQLALRTGHPDLAPCCDVAIGYYAWTLDIPLIGIRGFYHIDWTGFQYYAYCGAIFSFKQESILVAHYMDRALMHSYHHFLGHGSKLSARTYIQLMADKACQKATDINEHLPTLTSYAQECQVVVEMAANYGVSTWSLLLGLPEGGKLYYVAPAPATTIQSQTAMIESGGLNIEWVPGRSATAELPTEADLLFIDTWHIYGHLKRELQHHQSRIRKYIIMHDTTVDAERGESLRLGEDVQRQAVESGYPLEEITRGVWPAIEEFLQQYPHWELHRRYTNCNGLTILRRKVNL